MAFVVSEIQQTMSFAFIQLSVFLSCACCVFDRMLRMVVGVCIVLMGSAMASFTPQSVALLL